ncbi:MAG TPA: helix-turn-helix domain-containing protein [Acidimicrobiia bacterium]
MSDVSDLPAVLDANQVAELLGLNVQTVRLYAREGRIPAYRLPGSRTFRFFRDEILELVGVDLSTKPPPSKGRGEQAERPTHPTWPRPGRRATRIAERTDRLIESMRQSLEVFASERPFTGPSLYFHYRTIELVRRLGSMNNILAGSTVLEYLYATLTSWGMHRMGPGGAKLTEFDRFADGIRSHETALTGLQRLRISDLTDHDIPQVADQIWELIRSLDASTSGSFLVAGSKTLHHLLPDLVPPIDRQYTGRFFFGTSGKQWAMGEETAFREMFPQMVRATQEGTDAIQEYLRQPDGYMATSVTKVLDNAIVGYMKTEGSSAS